MFGTQAGDSYITSLDYSGSGDLVIGGKTKNPDFLSSLTSFKPYIATIDNTNTFKFAKIVNPSSNVLFTAVKYSYNKKLIIGQLDKQTQYTLIFLNSTNGDLVKVLRSSDSSPPQSMATDILADTLGNLWYGFTSSGGIPHIFGLSYLNLNAPTLSHFMQSKWNDGQAQIYKLSLQQASSGSQLVFFTFHQPSASPQKGGFVAINSTTGVIKFGKRIEHDTITSDLDGLYNMGSDSYTIFTCSSLYQNDADFRYTRHRITSGGVHQHIQFAGGSGSNLYFQCSGLKAISNTRFMRSENFDNHYLASYILDAFNAYYVGGTRRNDNTNINYSSYQGFVMSNIESNSCWSFTPTPSGFPFPLAGVSFSQVSVAQITQITRTMSDLPNLPLVSLNLSSNINKYCTEGSVTFNPISPISQQYTIGATTHQFTVPTFQLSQLSCTDGTYQDKALLTKKAGESMNPPEVLPQFISYDSTFKQFSIQTDDFYDYHEYNPMEITLTANIKELPSVTRSMIVTFTFNYDCTPAKTLGFSSQNNSATEIKVKLSIKYFDQSANDSLDLTIYLVSKPNHHFSLLLNTGPPLFQAYIQDIKLVANTEQNILFPLVQDPDGDSYSMKFECGAAIKFTKTSSLGLYFKPQNNDAGSYQQFKQNDLQLTIQASETSDQRMLDFSRRVTYCTNYQILIQLNFENPLYVSLQDRDQLQIVFLRNGYFKDASTLQPIKLHYSCTESIPNQLDKNSLLYQNKGLLEGSIDTTQVLVISNFAINILMSASLQYLWGMINALQLILAMPLLDIQLPANTKMFYNLLISMSSFDVLPTQELGEETLAKMEKYIIIFCVSNHFDNACNGCILPISNFNFTPKKLQCFVKVKEC
eukprot:403345374